MPNLEKRIEQLEDAVEITPDNTNELMVQRLVAAGEYSDLERNAVNSVRWAFMCGPTLTARALELLDAVGLAQRLLGEEVTTRLHSGEDGRKFAHVKDADQGDALCRMAVGGVRSDVCDWMLEHQDEWDGDPEVLLERVRAFDRDEELLERWQSEEQASHTN